MKRLTATALALGTATPALAHHPLAGGPMTTFSEGVLSGVGHPILGFDHLFFVALAGVAAMLSGLRATGIAAYLAAMLAGCGLIYLGGALPVQETVIALSLMVVGAAVASGRKLASPLLITLFAGFGLFHGAAFGGSIAGQEGGIGGAVLVGYLLGLGVIQAAVALSAGWAAEKLLGAGEAASVNARVAGALVAGAGLLLMLEQVEGAAFTALGWG